MRIIRNCYHAQGFGYYFMIQVWSVVFLFWKTGDYPEFRLVLFGPSPGRRFRLRMVSRAGNESPADRSPQDKEG